MKTVQQTDWKKRADLPAQHTVIPLDREFSAADMQRIRQGHRPQRMEDKWFIYWNDGKLFFHRSWSGYCIYVVHFGLKGESERMIKAEVNRCPEQYSEKSDTRDAKLISYLIDEFLLGLHSDFPPREK